MIPLYTRTGDSGETDLLGGERTTKMNVRLHAVGSVDELDALLGVLQTEDECSQGYEFKEIQRMLHRLKADLATPARMIGTATRVTEKDIERLETLIDALEANVPPLHSFVLPGGTPLAAKLHVARAICRRAERWTVTLARSERINVTCLTCLNRLSDYLFALARVVNAKQGKVEETV